MLKTHNLMVKKTDFSQPGEAYGLPWQTVNNLLHSCEFIYDVVIVIRIFLVLKAWVLGSEEKACLKKWWMSWDLKDE